MIGWMILLGLAGLVAVWILVCAGCMLWGQLPRAHAPEATVIVLGCKVKGEVPGLHLTKRIQAAYRYLQAHPQANCIGAGGKGVHERIPEGEAICRTLEKMGIAPHRLAAETRSANTKENLQFSQTILQERSWCRQVVLVTDSFHQYRAGCMASKLGLCAVPVSARRTWHTLPLNFPREVLAITKFWLTFRA